MKATPLVFNTSATVFNEAVFRDKKILAPARVENFGKKKLRAAHILRKFNPDEWGGTETVIQRLFDGLGENEVENIAFCPRTKKPATEFSEKNPLKKNGNRIELFNACVPIFGISSETKRQMISVGGNLVSFDLPIKMLREPELSVIHAHTLGRLGAMAATVARARRIPFVVTIHGGLLDLPSAMKENFSRPNHGGFEWGKILGFFFQSRKMLERADAILTCNPNETRLLREKFPRKRIQVQPHGIPVELYERDQRAAAREAFPQICERELLLCAGRIDAVKNQSWLLQRAPEIFKKHPRGLLVFAGAVTDEHYGEQFQKNIHELGLEKNILLTGGLPPGDPRLIGLFQESRALILPSISETFGIVLLEAWAAGTSVISSRTSGATALVKPGENGWLFDLENPREFHDALDAALLNPGLREQFSAAGREMARREFGVAAVAARVKKLYEELINEKLYRAGSPQAEMK